MKFRLKCREAHRLSIERMDRRLSWLETLRLRAHLAACDACSTVSAQVRLLRGAMRRLGADEPPSP
jgi:anti-sigma factor RsiW